MQKEDYAGNTGVVKMRKLKNWELERLQWNAAAEPFLIGMVLALVLFGPVISQASGLSNRSTLCFAILAFASVFTIGLRAIAFAKTVWGGRDKDR